MLLRPSINRPVLPHLRSKGVLLLCLVLAAIAGCQDVGLFSPNTRATSRLLLRPYFAVQSSSSAAVDINRIRVTITKLPENEVVDVEEIDVDPAASEWNLDLDVPANSELRILLELMNGETVVFSGLVEVSVTSGEQPSPPPVPVFPGPPENLSITGIAISPREQTIGEGREVPLTATVVGGPGANAIVTWVSLNSSVATVTGSGRTAQVTGVTPGEAVITALAGRVTDNIVVTVVARAATVEVTPSTATATSLNADVPFGGRVLDPRGNVIPGVGITWSIADPTIAIQTSPGVFRALRNGTTTVTASATHGGETITGTAALTVQQVAATIAIEPTSKHFSAFGQTQQFTVTARDAGGNPIPDCGCWTSSNPAVATVDATGLVTAVANGTTTIAVQVGGATAEAQVTVQQEAARITLNETDITLESINETIQLHAEVEDAAGNSIDLPVTWSSTVPTVATVSDDGLVTARGDGVVIIIASSGTRRATATVRVERVPRGVAIFETLVEIDAGTTHQLSGSVVDANGFPIDLPLAWSSNQPGVASVNATTGLVTGHSAGEAQISAQYGTMSATVTVIVSGQAGGGSNDGGDVIVFNDINVWDNTAFGRATNNEQFFRNLFGNTTTGTRSGATKIWLDHGRSSSCAGPCQTMTLFEAAVALDGLSVVKIASSSGTLVNIPSDVRALILWLPNVAYTTPELNALKAFAAEGGRIVFVGEHGSFYSGFGVENAFLAGMGSTMRVFPSFVDCGYVDLPEGSIKPHPITAGVTTLTMACSSVLELGPTDLPLYVDDGIGSEAYNGSGGSTPCNASCVLAGVTKIDTTPIVDTNIFVSQRRLRVDGMPIAVPIGVPPIPNPKSSTGY